MKVVLVALLFFVVFADTHLIKGRTLEESSLSKYVFENSSGFANSQLRFIKIYLIELGARKFGNDKKAHADYILGEMRTTFYHMTDWNVVIYKNLKQFSCFPNNFGLDFARRWFSSGFLLPHGYHYLIFQCGKYDNYDNYQKETNNLKSFKNKSEGVTVQEEETINNAISTALVIEKNNPFGNARYIYNSIFELNEFWRVCIASENSKVILRYSSPMKAWIEYENSGPYKWHYYIWRDSIEK